MNIFNEFCKYVDAHIFPKENVGMTLAFIIDQSFITEFCSANSISERMLMDSVRSNLYGIPVSNILKIKGILAIQMYAASKRANRDGVTEKNYRERLSQVLNWPMDELQRWMADYQEYCWETLYRWCDTHYYVMSKCQRKYGAGRYTQYPVQQALRVFTEEDLLYIAGVFVEKKLQPEEDLQESDFWRIVSKASVVRYLKTSHSQDVKLYSPNESSYLQQVYNYFLRWNGDYKDWYVTHRHNKEDAELRYYYLTGDFSRLEVRNDTLKLLSHFDIDNLSVDKVKGIYNFKREGVIVFKQDDVYENYWQETRYVERGQQGVLIIFKSRFHRSYYTLRNNILFENERLYIYKLEETPETSEYFTEPRFYSLEGGLRIGHGSYLSGGEPTLTMTKNVPFFIDGNICEKPVVEGRLSLNFLSVGSHVIQFKNCKRITIEIVDATFSKPTWISGNNHWFLSVKDAVWDSKKESEGITGLDFSFIPQSSESLPKNSVLQRWSRFHTFKEIDKKENNPIMNILINQNIL